MKRLFLICFLLTATCTISFVPGAHAQITAPPTVTVADFTTKVNLMDSYIGAGNMTMAQATWLEVHSMMMNVLAMSKYSIYSAPTPADRDAHITIFTNQQTLYHAIWGLKTDLATNRSAIHAKLGDFGATIY